ncbi:MAG: hypothetical protein NT154_21060 [Verrucomicrobia bacterium]|nr:hypothetical protein [Verrucomicrobiota bacterium]
MSKTRPTPRATSRTSFASTPTGIRGSGEVTERGLPKGWPKSVCGVNLWTVKEKRAVADQDSKQP